MTRNEGKRKRLHEDIAEIVRDMFERPIVTDAVIADAILDKIWHELDERLYEAAKLNIQIKDEAIRQLTAERDDYAAIVHRVSKLARLWVGDMPANVTESVARVIRAEAGQEILRELEPADKEKDLSSPGGAS